MQDEQGNATRLLTTIQEQIGAEDRRALGRAKTGIVLRAVLVLFVAGYMTWLFAAVSKLDAPALTQAAALHVEQRIPDVRAELRDMAIAKAPELTDRARDVVLELPVQLRQGLEGHLIERTDELIARLERDVDAAITTVVNDQLEIVRREMPGAGPEQQLDAIILGVSATFRDTMFEATDELYEHYSEELHALVERLEHLQRADDLTQAEQIDRQLIEAWMVLVHKHAVTDPLRVAEGLQTSF